MKKYLALLLGAFLLTCVLLFAYKSNFQTHKSRLAQQTNLPNKLVISRSLDKLDHLPALEKTITDNAKVAQLYKIIFAMPVMPLGPRTCPPDKFARYVLDFYTNDKRTVHAVYDPTGCGDLQIEGEKTRWGSSMGTTISAELKQLLGISDKDFYGQEP